MAKSAFKKLSDDDIISLITLTQKEVAAAAGCRLLVAIYSEKSTDSLDSLRYATYTKLCSSSKTAISPEQLPLDVNSSAFPPVFPFICKSWTGNHLRRTAKFRQTGVGRNSMENLCWFHNGLTTSTCLMCLQDRVHLKPMLLSTQLSAMCFCPCPMA